MRALRPTRRQLEILQHRSRGRDKEEIGDRLGISPATVRTHEEAARMRLGAQNIAHAVAICFRKGWIR